MFKGVDMILNFLQVVALTFTFFLFILVFFACAVMSFISFVGFIQGVIAHNETKGNMIINDIPVSYLTSTLAFGTISLIMLQAIVWVAPALHYYLERMI